MKKKIWLLPLGIALFLLLSPYLKSRPLLTVAGSIKMADGLGRQAVELMDTFYGDFPMNCYPTSKFVVDEVPNYILKLVKTHPRKRELGKVLFYEETLLCQRKKPERWLKKLGPRQSDQIRIAYSMCESTILPLPSVERLNRHFDAVAVPDPFLIAVYQNSGVTIPIFYLPLGLKLTSFLTHPLKEKAHTPFCFMNLSSCEPRKNYEALIRAFHLAFPNDPNVVLRINFRTHHEDALEKATALIQELEATNIFLTNEKLHHQQYVEFMAQGDVFVTFSKGEGFSIQPREAMALGMPVILSDNTAHSTILQSQLALGVSCPQQEASFNLSFQSPSGSQFLVDIEEASLILQKVYTNYENEMSKAKNRREWARQFEFSELKQLYRNMIFPQTVIYGDRNEVTKEGLTTSSRALYEKYLKLIENNI